MQVTILESHSVNFIGTNLTPERFVLLTEASSSPSKKRAKAQGEQEAQKERKVFFLRRSSRVTAAQAPTNSDEDDDADEEHVPFYLSEGVFDADEDDMDEEALRSVERKCPYCPDRFHNGIGLANHVRGHLKRVGVSYNVRHFISPEEVNAIEKKFSYQKKKKKGQSLSPLRETFQVPLALSWFSNRTC